MEETRNQTLLLVKPTAVKNNYIGGILKMVNDAGFKIGAIKLVNLKKWQADLFYRVHAQKPFYDELTDFIASGPVLAALLIKEDAVKELRELIGATNPKEAKQGTIRNKYGESTTHNAVHASDTDANAIHEIDFFFSLVERFE
ncbi:MAG: nucleoside-diphosphate kinase [Bacteroidales bacterium]